MARAIQRFVTPSMAKLLKAGESDICVVLIGTRANSRSAAACHARSDQLPPSGQALPAVSLYNEAGTKTLRDRTGPGMAKGRIGPPIDAPLPRDADQVTRKRSTVTQVPVPPLWWVPSTTSFSVCTLSDRPVRVRFTPNFVTAR